MIIFKTACVFFCLFVCFVLFCCQFHSQIMYPSLILNDHKKWQTAIFHFHVYVFKMSRSFLQTQFLSMAIEHAVSKCVYMCTPEPSSSGQIGHAKKNKKKICNFKHAICSDNFLSSCRTVCEINNMKMGRLKFRLDFFAKSEKYLHLSSKTCSLAISEIIE